MIQSTQLFEDFITEVVIENVPKKSLGNNRKIPKERKRLLNRIKMLKRGKHRAYSRDKKKTIEMKILESEHQLMENRRKEKLENEKRCIDCMIENPRMIYSFVNKQRNRRNEIGPFNIDGKLIHDGKEVCNTLKIEYSSQMSERSDIENSNLFDECNDDDLTDIEFNKKSVEDAINELNENSSGGPDGLPAIFLKKTKETISTPLALLLRKSIDKEKIPEIFKLAYVTPIQRWK